MPRARQCRTLDTGPRLDINELIRAGLRSGTFKARMAVDGSPVEGELVVHMDDGPLRWMEFRFPGHDWLDQGPKTIWRLPVVFLLSDDRRPGIRALAATWPERRRQPGVLERAGMAYRSQYGPTTIALCRPCISLNPRAGRRPGTPPCRAS